MEMFDPAAEQQVWQRVLARQETRSDTTLRAMEQAAMELAACFRRLSGTLTGRQRELVRQLQEGEQANAAALRGIARLCGSEEEVLKPWNPGKAPPRRLLEACYHKARRCMVDYLSRSAEPEYGAVFRLLSDREARHCLLLAELLGLRETP